MGAPEGIAPGGIGPSTGFIPGGGAPAGEACAGAATPAAGIMPDGNWGSDLSDIFFITLRLK
jgi:hypothetical protein